MKLGPNEAVLRLPTAGGGVVEHHLRFPESKPDAGFGVLDAFFRKFPPTEAQRAEALRGVREREAARAERAKAAPRDQQPHQVSKPRHIPETQARAYRALRYSGKLGAQQRTVVDLFLTDPKKRRTRKEIERDTGLTINATCGRVNELLEEGVELLRVNGEKTCEVTGNSVEALELATE